MQHDRAVCRFQRWSIVRDPKGYTRGKVGSEDAILGCEVFILKQEFLIDQPGDVRQQPRPFVVWQHPQPQKAQHYPTAIRAALAIGYKCLRFKATAQLAGEIPTADRLEAIAAAETALEAFEYSRFSFGKLERATEESSPAEIE